MSSAVLHNWHLSVCDNFLIQIRNAVHGEEHLPPSASLWFLQIHGAAEQYRLEQPGVSPKASSYKRNPRCHFSLLWLMP